MTRLSWIGQVVFKHGSRCAEICKISGSITDDAEELVDDCEFDFDGDVNYLGAIVFPFYKEDKDKALMLCDHCYRAFTAGGNGVEDGFRVYYDADHSGEEGFFSNWLANEDDIDYITIEADFSDSTTREEFEGKVRQIELRR